MHRESDDAKSQLAMETQIAAKEQQVMRELEAAAAARAAEEGHGEAEEVEDSAALRNQFNFSDRTYQTNTRARRDAEAMTVPPTAIDFAATAVRNYHKAHFLSACHWGNSVQAYRFNAASKAENLNLLRFRRPSGISGIGILRISRRRLLSQRRRNTRARQRRSSLLWLEKLLIQVRKSSEIRCTPMRCSARYAPWSVW